MPGLYRFPPAYPHPQQVRRQPNPRENPALNVVCGAECHINGPGQNVGTGARHWTSSTGSPTISTSVFRSGAKSFEFLTNGDGLRYSFGAGWSVIYGLFFLRLSDATPSANVTLFRTLVNGGSNFSVLVNTSGVLQVTHSSTQSGPTLSDNTWYGVEFECDISANPHTVKWRTWDAGTWTDRTDISAALAADTFNNGQTDIGWLTGAAASESVYIDDVRIGICYRAGDHYSSTPRTWDAVGRIRPNVDGTHAFNDNDFEYNDTTGILASATDVYTYLDDDNQTDTADFIDQAVAGAGKYFRIGFEDASANTSSIGQVALTAHLSAVTTSTTEIHVQCTVDGGSLWRNLLGDWGSTGDSVGTSAGGIYRHIVMREAPPGVAWTPALLNALELRAGNSGDVSPNPKLVSASFEYEYAASPATEVDAELASGTGAAYNATGTITTTAGLASGTGTALAASVNVQPNAAIATGTGAAYNASVNVAPSAGLATGTGAGLAAAPSVGVNAGNATGTGEAYQPTILAGTLAPAELASGTGAAPIASISLAPTAGIAIGMGDALAAAPGIGVVPAAASGTGVAYDATVSTVSQTNAPAELASATGAALQPSIAIATGAGLAAATAAALAASVNVAPTAGNAAAGGSAYGPTALVAPNAGLASGVAATNGVLIAIAVNTQTATATGEAEEAIASQPPSGGVPPVNYGINSKPSAVAILEPPRAIATNPKP